MNKDKFSDDDKKLAELLKNHDMDMQSQKAVRDERIPDLAFARWSQLDDTMKESCTTEFMGQFDIISRERDKLCKYQNHGDSSCGFQERGGS